MVPKMGVKIVTVGPPWEGRKMGVKIVSLGPPPTRMGGVGWGSGKLRTAIIGWCGKMARIKITITIECCTFRNFLRFRGITVKFFPSQSFMI